jgi:hypothetical protein
VIVNANDDQAAMNLARVQMALDILASGFLLWQLSALASHGMWGYKLKWYARKLHGELKGAFVISPPAALVVREAERVLRQGVTP